MAVEVKKEKKRMDRVLLVSIILCVSLALGIVGFVFLPEPITASVKLRGVKKFIANSSDVVVVLNAPLEMEGILNDKEAVLRENDAKIFIEKLSSVLENVKYYDTKSAEFGIWKTKIVIYNTTDECVIYIDNDGVYIENKGKIIQYKMDDDAKSEYDALIYDIYTRLEMI